MRARDSVRCDTEETNRAGFLPGVLIDIAKDAEPLLVDTAEATKEGLYSMDAAECAMVMGVACDSDSSSDEEASNSRRTDMDGSGSVGDTDVGGVASGEYKGCRDVESLTPLHQILLYITRPWDGMVLVTKQKENNTKEWLMGSLRGVRSAEEKIARSCDRASRSECRSIIH